MKPSISSHSSGALVTIVVCGASFPHAGRCDPLVVPLKTQTLHVVSLRGGARALHIWGGIYRSPRQVASAAAEVSGGEPGTPGSPGTSGPDRPGRSSATQSPQTGGAK